MSKQDRQEKLAALVFGRGTVRIDELLDELDVSAMTLYRDLADLEARRAIVRTRGEVSAAATSLSETSFGFRLGLEAASKRALSSGAAELVGRGDSVFIDDSTTSYFALEHLLAQGNKLTVVTNCHAPAELAMQHPDVDLIMVGGRFMRRLQACYGPAALEAISRLRVDVALLGAAAVQGGVVLHPYEEVAAFKGAVLGQAATKALLVTGSKFERTALHTVSRLDEFDVIVTDVAGGDEASEDEQLAAAAQAGVRVVSAPA